MGPIAQKKTDYGLAFSPRHDRIGPVYEKVSFSGRFVSLSQMTDTYTQMLAILLGVEVKANYGNEVEAQTQLAVWLAAGLKHRRDLAKAATGGASAMDDVPMLGWTVIGHRWDLYMAFIEDSSTGDIVSSLKESGLAF